MNETNTETTKDKHPVTRKAGQGESEASMKATWRKMVGTALLWVALAALVHIPTSDGAERTTIVAVLAFVSFAAGLALFADGLKRDIVEQLGQARGGS